MLACPTCSRRLSRSSSKHGAIYPCRTCGGKAVAVSVLKKTAGHHHPVLKSRGLFHFLQPEAQGGVGAAQAADGVLLVRIGALEQEGVGRAAPVGQGGEEA